MPTDTGQFSGQHRVPKKAPKQAIRYTTPEGKVMYYMKGTPGQGYIPIKESEIERRGYAVKDADMLQQRAIAQRLGSQAKYKPRTAAPPQEELPTGDDWDVDGDVGDGGAAASIASQERIAAAALEQQKKESLAGAVGRFLEARLGDRAGRRSSSQSLLETLGPSAVSDEGAALLGKMFAGINQGGAVEQTFVPIDYAALTPTDVNAEQAAADAAARSLLGMAEGGAVMNKSPKRGIFRKRFHRAADGINIAKDIDTVIKGVLANTGVLSDLAGQFGVAPQQLVDSIMATYGAAPGSVKLPESIAGRQQNLAEKSFESDRAARLAEMAANPRRVLEAGYYQAGLEPTERAKNLQNLVSGPVSAAFAKGGTVSGGLQGAIERRKAKANAYRADVGLTVDDNTFGRLRVGPAPGARKPAAGGRFGRGGPRDRGRENPGMTPTYSAKDALALLRSGDAKGAQAILRGVAGLQPMSRPAPAPPTIDPRVMSRPVAMGWGGLIKKAKKLAKEAEDVGKGLYTLSGVKGVKDVTKALEKKLQKQAEGGVVGDEKRPPFGRAAAGKSVEGPAIILVGEGKKDEGVKMGTHEYLLAPPGTVVAPGKKGETPSMMSAVTAIRRQLKRANVSEGSEHHKMLDMATGGALSPEKAKKILRDGEVRGKPLTEKQRGFFGARASGQPLKRALLGYVGPQEYQMPTDRPATAVDALKALRGGDPTAASNILRGVAGLKPQQSDISVAATPGVTQMGQGSLYDPLGGADPEIRRIFGGRLPTLRDYRKMSPTQKALLESALSKGKVDVGDLEERLTRDFEGFGAQVGTGQTARFGRFS